MKQTPPDEHQRSTYNEQPTHTEYQSKFCKAIACSVFTLLIIMLPGSLVQVGQGGDDALFIDKNGRVGIGTATPKAELEVAGSIKVNGAVGINRVPANDQHLAIQPLEDHIRCDFLQSPF